MFTEQAQKSEILCAESTHSELDRHPFNLWCVAGQCQFVWEQNLLFCFCSRAR